MILDHEGYEYEVDVDVFSEVFKDLPLSEIITVYGKLRGPSTGRAAQETRQPGFNTMKGALHDLIDKMDGLGSGMDIAKAADLVTKVKRKSKVLYLHRPWQIMSLASKHQPM